MPLPLLRRTNENLAHLIDLGLDRSLLRAAGTEPAAHILLSQKKIASTVRILIELASSP
jgi:hypothetical protein